MAFDVAAAKQAGYSDAEIAEFLGKQKGFDVAAAMKAGYSPVELIDYLGGGAPAKKSTVGSELKRGAQQVASSMQTAYGALTGSPEEAARAGLERGQAINQVAGEGVGFEPVKKAYQEKGLMSAAGEALGQIPRALAGQGANLATMATGARLGAMAGSPLGPAGVIGGGVLGAGAAMLPQFFGSNVERQAAEQMERGEPVKIDRTKAGAAAAGQAALEGAGAAFTLGKGVVKGVLGIVDDAAITSAKTAQQLEATARRSLTGTVARGAGRGVVGEMPVEIAQQVIERAQAGLDLTSPEALKEYGEAAYQAGLVGGPLGAAGNVVTRGQAQGALEAKAKADADAQRAALEARGPQVPAEVPAGTQGTLFSDAEMGERVAAPAAPPAEPEAAVSEGQQDLNLDYQREYADMVQERERLKQQEQTPEVKARIDELGQQMALYTQSDIESIRAETEGATAQAQADAEAAKQFPGLANAPDLMAQSDEVKTRTQGELFPGEDLGAKPEEPVAEPTLRQKAEVGPKQVPLSLRRNPEGQPTTFGQPEPTITSADIMLTAVPVPKGVEGWLLKNVVGGTRTQLDAMIAKDPTLVQGSTPRAKILRSLTAKEVPAFKEAPSVKPTPAPTPAVEQRNEPRAGEPSVGVSGEPAAPVVSEPGAGVPTPTAAPVAPDGRRLVPVGRPAEQRNAPQGAEPAAVETADEEAARKAEAEDFKRRLEALEKAKPVTPAAAKPAAPAPKTAEPSKPIPEKLREPVGRTDFGGEDTILRGPQGMLFPMNKREETEYAEQKQAEPDTEEAEAEPATTKDERQAELDFTKAVEPKPEPKTSAIAEWAAPYSKPTHTVVYSDDEVALVRVVNLVGDQFYRGMSKARNAAETRVDIDNYTGDMFTDAQKDRLLDARAKAVFAESKRAAKNPSGPFTGAGTNVVKSDSVDQRYANLLRELMQSMGLGGVRVFLVHPEDMRPADAQDKYKLYKSYETAQTAGFGAGEEGATQPMGPERRDFFLSLKSGMTENKSVEVITHELGHIIELVAFKDAPADVQAAVKKEHENWLKSTRGATGRELVQMLRNRETAETQMLSVPEGKTAEQMGAYWKSFSEWFADNTSRWASTANKPVTITEKFFSRVAQMMRDLVAVVTGRKYPPNKLVADFLDKMGPGSADSWVKATTASPQPPTKASFSVAPATRTLIDSMGDLEAKDKPLLTRLIEGFKAQPELGYATKFRTQAADAAATIEHRLRERFDGAVRNSLGKLNPMGLYRQAQDHAKLLLEYFQQGSLIKDPTTGLWRVGTTKGVRPPAAVYELIDKYAAKNGQTREEATKDASRILEGVRLDAMRTSNKNDGTDFALHLKDSEIDLLLREYNADPDLKEMSKLMDEARIAMVDNMVAVGRLTPETGDAWKDAVGYVPFDRLEDENFVAAFSKIKKISNKGLAQVGKLPELVGSLERPVGNVFDNYLNTLGWMVGQTMKTDATVQTLRALEDISQATYLGPTDQKKDNTVSMYVKGEMRYWELPSKYDVMAFKDLNPPKTGWLRALGSFSNVLRKSVTILPPFALKQVTDDVQRAIMTSGVKSPGALLRMSLANFPKLAYAELRGIQHPMVREFGALGLTGEYDFQAGKPATSLLKDLKYKPRGKFETLLHRLDGITRASDLAVRKAIYDQTMKESNNDALLAQTRAREFINFRRRGASDFVGAMVTTIPFFNAYIQGMDVLYRAASGKDSSSSVGRAHARRMFWSRASTVMMLSSLYALGKDDDDEDYKEMDLRTRDGNWILPGGYKIPVPGELGAIFKVIPERVVEYMKRQGTPEEQTAWEATRTALSYMYEQYVGRATPIPQAVKPLFEAWANKSFLTGRALEGFHHRTIAASLRETDQTSELAKVVAASDMGKAISEFSKLVIGVEVSPIMVDNALRGYFGSTAALLTATTDSLLNPTRVDRPLHKWALLSTYLYDPVGNRRMTEFYEERDRVSKAGSTLRELMRTDMDKAAAYAEEHADELQLESAVNATLQQLEDTRAYRKHLNSPDGAAEVPAEEREAQLKEIKQLELQYVRWLREAKAAIGQ